MEKLYDFFLLIYVKFYIRRQQFFDWYEEMDKKYNLLRGEDKNE